MILYESVQTFGCHNVKGYLFFDNLLFLPWSQWQVSAILTANLKIIYVVYAHCYTK